ncbi:hypothetical protein DFH09DRAFT_1092574 [Mycena vulgaris]|nr:hypothetical protein DFH09DRAFT_1092574 [Mycena vulgaris]
MYGPHPSTPSPWSSNAAATVKRNGMSDVGLRPWELAKLKPLLAYTPMVSLRCFKPPRPRKVPPPVALRKAAEMDSKLASICAKPSCNSLPACSCFKLKSSSKPQDSSLHMQAISIPYSVRRRPSANVERVLTSHTRGDAGCAPSTPRPLTLGAASSRSHINAGPTQPTAPSPPSRPRTRPESLHQRALKSLYPPVTEFTQQQDFMMIWATNIYKAFAPNDGVGDSEAVCPKTLLLVFPTRAPTPADFKLRPVAASSAELTPTPSSPGPRIFPQLFQHLPSPSIMWYSLVSTTAPPHGVTRVVPIKLNPPPATRTHTTSRLRLTHGNRGVRSGRSALQRAHTILAVKCRVGGK